MHTIVSIAAGQIINAGTSKQIEQALRLCETPEQQYDALKMSSNQILIALETSIAQKNHQIAIWELSKLAIVDDELLKAERVLNGVVSLVMR